MTKRYIVVDYDGGKSETPTVAFDSTSQEPALQHFEEIKDKNEKRSVVLFNTVTGEVEKIAILGEPIYLAKAITFAREQAEEAMPTEATIHVATEAAELVIEHIAEAVTKGTLPGVGGAILGHFIAPYYALKGDGVGAVKAATGMYGGVSGAVIGSIVGGPPGALIGGAIGATVLGEGAGAIVGLGLKRRRCKYCKGSGLVGYYEICSMCDGYGYYRNK